MSDPQKYKGVVLSSSKSDKALNERQRIAYVEHRKQYIDWLLTQGKNPAEREGYSRDTIKVYATIHDAFMRRVWVDHGGYTTAVTHDHADNYIYHLCDSEENYSQSYKHNVKLALLAYFRFRTDLDDWDCPITISSASNASQPRDFLTSDERRKVREAALEYGTVPAYSSLTPDAREKWRAYLARRFGKPMNEVSPDDWKRANGFKYPSLVCTALDAGLRPVEVGRARVGWVDLDNGALRIPYDQSAKNEENWAVSLTDETTTYLARWLEERELYEKYDDTDRLWLTRHANPYTSSGLRPLLENLREISGIQREFTWYAIRHSTGTYMAREEGLAAAQAQLRHRNIETTAKYDNVTVEDRRDALNRMG